VRCVLAGLMQVHGWGHLGSIEQQRDARKGEQVGVWISRPWGCPLALDINFGVLVKLRLSTEGTLP
jgi:hypothetical protein